MEQKSANKQPKEYETHTTALVFLVLAVLVICFVALAWSHQTNQSEKGYSATSTTSTRATSSPSPVTNATSSSGPVIPITRPATTPESTVDGLPAGLPLNQADIKKNYTAELSADTHQRTVIFETDSSLADLKDQYDTWITQSAFSQDSQTTPADAALTIQASRGNDQLTIAIMTADARRRIQLTYVTQK